MFNYQSTPLEDWITQLYRHLNISEPHQIDMTNIAAKLNVWIYFRDTRSQAVDINGNCSMVIDRRLSPPEQWQDFGHELCHLLRQAGNQMYLPESFVRYQETKADYFALEFCVPSFMLVDVSLPQTRREAIDYVAEAFNVTHRFAQRRLVQIENRMLGSRLSTQFAATVEAGIQYRQNIGCDYVFETRNGIEMYSRDKGYIGRITRKNEWEV